jgi:hypothetical protein
MRNWFKLHATQLSALVAAVYALAKAGYDWRHNGTPADPSTIGAVTVAIMALFAHTSNPPPTKFP